MKKITLSFVSVCAMSSFVIAGGDFTPVIQPIIETPVVDTIVDSKYAVGVKVGTLGLGLDISRSITDKLNLRFNINGATYSDTGTESDVEYDYDLDMITAGLLLDYYPMESEFRLSAGAYYNGNEFALTGKPTTAGTFDINGVTYTTADLGSLKGTVDFDEFAPYIGIGWGNSTKKAGWGFSVDVGLMYHGEPNVDLTAVKGSAVTTAEDAFKIANPTATQAQIDAASGWDVIEANVQAEESDLINELNDYKIYPVVSFGVTYTF